MKTLAERVKLACKARKVTQTKLCELAGIPTPQYLSRILAGDRSGVSHLEAIAKALDCSVNWLAVGVGAPPYVSAALAAAAVAAKEGSPESPEFWRSEGSGKQLEGQLKKIGWETTVTNEQLLVLVLSLGARRGLSKQLDKARLEMLATFTAALDAAGFIKIDYRKPIAGIGSKKAIRFACDIDRSLKAREK